MKNLATTLAKRRTSLDLPPDLLERTDEAVRLGVARSRNNLIAAALEDYLDAMDRIASIDARFAEMERDTKYREMHLALAAGFAESDVEALATDLVDKTSKAPETDVVANDSTVLALEQAGP